MIDSGKLSRWAELLNSRPIEECCVALAFKFSFNGLPFLSLQELQANAVPVRVQAIQPD